MEHRIVGTTMPVAELMLQPDESVFAESGELAWISMSIQLRTGMSVGGQQGGFMAGTPGIQLGVGFQQRLGAGIFGGTGFRMQRLTGQGLAFVELHGEVVHYELQPGNTLRVHPGHVAMFEETVDFNVTTMPGIRNALFGGEGLFLATLTGPGRVWLQSMSLPHLAHAIGHYMPHPSGEGSLIGGLLQGS